MEPTEHNHPGREELHPTVAYEERDANTVTVIKFGVWLGAGILASMAFLGWFFNLLKQHEASESPAPAPMAAQLPKQPPHPRLQPTPMPDLKAMRDAEEQVLNNYAWIDPDKGIVRMPIDKALDLVAQKGFPVLPPGAPSAQTVKRPDLPQDSSSGRTMERRTQ